MHYKLRKYLIETARQKDKFAFYSDIVIDCELRINLKSEYGRKHLTALLGEVSEFENNSGRPLISAMAIYKDSRRNDHGDGFYMVAEKLGKGSFKNLKYGLFGFAEAEACRRFWQDEGNYGKYK
ncbi:MAG TPA: hypothetical protein VK508_12750 [Cyclobacteriaceae bacterium]|nr:hypothetical protein [Cyclobacteriaceae bacterium]